MSKSIYESVVSEIYRGVDHISEAAWAFPWENKMCYGHWLTQTYHYVIYSTRFAALASGFCSPEDQFFHYEFMAGVKEEKGHDILALNDLKRLGFKLGDFKELFETASFYQTLTYYILRLSHFAVLGYSTPLEGFAALKLKPIYERVKAAHGVNATSFIRVHCEADVDHFKGALEMLEKCDQRPLEIIGRATKQASYIYRSIFDGIVSDISIKKERSSRKAASLGMTV